MSEHGEILSGADKLVDVNRERPARPAEKIIQKLKPQANLAAQQSEWPRFEDVRSNLLAEYVYIGQPTEGQQIPSQETEQTALALVKKERGNHRKPRIIDITPLMNTFLKRALEAARMRPEGRKFSSWELVLAIFAGFLKGLGNETDDPAKETYKHAA
jgi:hypothetical protein